MTITKRLRQVFATAAAGTLAAVSLGAMALSSLNTYNDLKAQPYSYDPDAPASWVKILAHDSRPYDPAGVVKPSYTPRHVQVVQVENIMDRMSVPGLYLTEDLLLKDKDLALQLDLASLYGRHGEAATSILQGGAADGPIQGVDTHFVARADISQWFWDHGDSYAAALYKNADIVSISMGIYADEGFSNGALTERDQIDAADKFWQENNAIIVRAAGNKGIEGLGPAPAVSYMRADTVLGIGTGGLAPDGAPYISSYTSCVNASIIVKNPFYEGYSYPYYMTGDLARTTIENYLSYKLPQSDTRVKNVFALRLQERLHDRAYDARFEFLIAAMEKLIPAADYQAFPGKTVLKDKSALWQSKNPDAVRAAFVDGLVRMSAAFAIRSGADAQGNATNIAGTSFSTPQAGYMLAKMRAHYPQLTEYDLVAAALIAAEPAYIVKNKAGKTMAAITYEDNGRGLPYNDFLGGFGYLSEEALTESCAEMAALLKDNPALATQRRAVFVPQVTVGKAFTMPQLALSFTQNSDGTYAGSLIVPPAALEDVEYDITVDDDIVTGRAHLALQFKSGPCAAPAIIELINPAGVAINIVPTRPKSNDPQKYSLASTDGHFGNYTKGIWKIRLPRYCELTSVTLSFNGMQKGGVVDEVLKNQSQIVPHKKLSPPVIINTPAPVGS